MIVDVELVLRGRISVPDFVVINEHGDATRFYQRECREFIRSAVLDLLLRPDTDVGAELGRNTHFQISKRPVMLDVTKLRKECEL